MWLSLFIMPRLKFGYFIRQYKYRQLGLKMLTAKNDWDEALEESARNTEAREKQLFLEKYGYPFTIESVLKHNKLVVIPHAPYDYGTSDIVSKFGEEYTSDEEDAANKISNSIGTTIFETQAAILSSIIKDKST